MPKKRHHRVKTRTHKPVSEEEQMSVPHSLVFAKAKVGGLVAALMKDWRKVNLPYTAYHVKVTNRNTIKDMVKFSAQYGITHLHVFSCPDKGAQLKISRVPQGPTICFNILSFTLAKEIARQHKRPVHGSDVLFSTPPLLVLNNIQSAKGRHWRLTQSMLETMHPMKHLDEIKLHEFKRLLLFSVNKETEVIDVRHYAIHCKPSGNSTIVRKVMKLRKMKRIPKLKDVSDLVTSGMDYYSSDDSDAEAPEVELPHSIGNQPAKSKSLIKVVELGPRMTLRIDHITSELMGGIKIYSNTKDALDGTILEEREEEDEQLWDELTSRAAERPTKRRKVEDGEVAAGAAGEGGEDDELSDGDGEEGGVEEEDDDEAAQEESDDESDQ